MNQKSFAQILKEFNTQAPSSASFENSQYQSFSTHSQTNFNANQTNFELNQIGLFKKNNTTNKKQNYHFKSKNPYSTFQSRKPFEDQSQAQNAPTKVTNKNSDKAQKMDTNNVIEIKKRLPGIPHKLSEPQKTSLTYFIQNFEFLLEDFTQEELRRSFKKLCFKLHPDQNSTASAEGFIELKKHFDILNVIFKNSRTKPV